MFNRYKAGGKTLKEFKIKNFKSGTAKNGSTYNIFQISDSNKNANGGYDYDTYKIFTWGDNLNLQDGDKIVIEDINALDIANKEWNGKPFLEKTIFADIKVTAQANPNKVEVVGDLPNLNDLQETLPF